MSDVPPDLTPIFAALDGAQILGGCDQCDAYQTASIAAHVFRVTVHHDDWCPVLAAHECGCVRCSP